MKKYTLALLVGMAGCVTAEYTPPTVPEPREMTITVDADFDTTWEALINHASATFFAIDNFEKESGLLTLSFGIGEPERFIDCGIWRQTMPAADEQPYVRYLIQGFQTEFDGRMNITVRRAGDAGITVRVNARYVLSVSGPGGSEVWAFDTGGSASHTVVTPTLGTDAVRVCRPTHEAERSILDAIAGLTG